MKPNFEQIPPSAAHENEERENPPMLSELDKKILSIGAERLIEFFKDAQEKGRLPSIIIYPDVSARPLAYLVKPIIDAVVRDPRQRPLMEFATTHRDTGEDMPGVWDEYNLVFGHIQTNTERGQSFAEATENALGRELNEAVLSVLRDHIRKTTHEELFRLNLADPKACAQRIRALHATTKWIDPIVALSSRPSPPTLAELRATGVSEDEEKLYRMLLTKASAQKAVTEKYRREIQRYTEIDHAQPKGDALIVDDFYLEGQTLNIIKFYLQQVRPERRVGAFVFYSFAPRPGRNDFPVNVATRRHNPYFANEAGVTEIGTEDKPIAYSGFNWRDPTTGHKKKVGVTKTPDKPHAVPSGTSHDDMKALRSAISKIAHETLAKHHK
jgi:hypothetical protein